jgi:pimeloyl-ACP methyl ester carboxylesterase
MTAIREAMARKLAPLTRVVESDASHAVIWEKPDEIAAIVRSLPAVAS